MNFLGGSAVCTIAAEFKHMWQQGGETLENRGDAGKTALLVEHAMRGDEQSFRMLYRQFAPKARGTLRHMAGSQNLDDLVQDVFERVWKSLPKIRNSGAFSTWFYRITWNVAMDARKDSATGRARMTPLMDDFSAETFETGGAKSGIESSIATKIVVEMALNTLDLEHRSVLVLAEYEELPMSEISAVLEIPEGTVKSRLFNARKQMRVFLESKGVKI